MDENEIDFLFEIVEYCIVLHFYLPKKIFMKRITILLMVVLFISCSKEVDLIVNNADNTLAETELRQLAAEGVQSLSSENSEEQNLSNYKIWHDKYKSLNKEELFLYHEYLIDITKELYANSSLADAMTQFVEYEFERVQRNSEYTLELLNKPVNQLTEQELKTHFFQNEVSIDFSEKEVLESAEPEMRAGCSVYAFDHAMVLKMGWSGSQPSNYILQNIGDKYDGDCDDGFVAWKYGLQNIAWASNYHLYYALRTSLNPVNWNINGESVIAVPARRTASGYCSNVTNRLFIPNSSVGTYDPSQQNPWVSFDLNSIRNLLRVSKSTTYANHHWKFRYNNCN